jgi:hypothetical protein
MSLLCGARCDDELNRFWCYIIGAPRGQKGLGFSSPSTLRLHCGLHKSAPTVPVRRTTGARHPLDRRVEVPRGFSEQPRFAFLTWRGRFPTVVVDLFATFCSVHKKGSAHILIREREAHISHHGSPAPYPRLHHQGLDRKVRATGLASTLRAWPKIIRN